MNLTQGNIFWEDTMKIKYNYPYMTKDINADVLIVGGGITGAITAYYQAKMGQKVVLVDKNIIGLSSTLENTGVILDGINKENVNMYKKYSKDAQKLDELNTLAMEDILKIAKEIKLEDNVKLVDTVYFTDRLTGKFGLNKMYDTYISMCEDWNKKNNTEIIYEKNGLNMCYGINFKNTAIVLNPYVFTQELINYLSLMPNVKIYENTKIESIYCKENFVELITNNKFKIHSKRVILATGMEALKYVEGIDVEYFQTYNLVAKIISNDVKNNEIYVAKNMLYNKTLRMVRENILISGEDMKITRKDMSVLEDDRIYSGKYKRLYQNLLKFLNTEDVKITNSFFGVYMQTKDGLPIIDEVYGMPGVYCNLAVGKNGILQSVIGAKMLQNICNDCYSKDMFMFRANR